MPTGKVEFAIEVQVTFAGVASIRGGRIVAARPGQASASGTIKCEERRLSPANSASWSCPASCASTPGFALDPGAESSGLESFVYMSAESVSVEIDCCACSKVHRGIPGLDHRDSTERLRSGAPGELDYFLVKRIDGIDRILGKNQRRLVGLRRAWFPVLSQRSYSSHPSASPKEVQLDAAKKPSPRERPSPDNPRF